MTTTTNTTVRAAQPSATKRKAAAKPKKPTKKTAKKAAVTKQTAATGAQPGLDPQTAALLKSLGVDPASLIGGDGSIDALYGQGESTVRGYNVYITPSNAFVGTHGAQRTKIKASDLYDKLPTMSAADYRRLQERLFAGGFYGTADKKAIAFGDKYDPDTREALARAVARNVIANQTTTRGKRITLDNIIDDAIANAPAALKDGGATGPVFSYQPPDPVALRRSISDALPALMGRTLDPGEVDSIAAQVEAHMEASERSAFNAQQNGGIAAPAFDPKSYLEQQVEARHPDEFHAHKLATLSEEFLSSIGSFTQADRVF